MGDQLKAAVSVSEMAQMVGLSRARLYELIGSAFPWPVYNVSNHRPVYTKELQLICLEIKRTGLGFDGEPVVFNTKRHGSSERSRRPRKTVGQVPSGSRHDDLLNSLRALGLSTVSGQQVESALTTLFPNGVDGNDQGQIIRAVFLHLRQKSGTG